MQFYMITKINTTFAVMKRQKEVLFKIVFLLAVFFSIELYGASDYIARPIYVEHSTEPNSVVNSFISDVGSFDQDQIDQTYGFSSAAVPVYHIPVPQGFFLISKFSFSIWQPPKFF
jgi:hypothetical protein